ncbi:MAG: FKBP-type peptidyl-prolyl cis-trans isomerase [Thermoplasmata archaeon]|nr:FKBP-type peptidyl-prolyl cis-trans isomerase [Thermoplasmata archaeon]
MAKTNESIWKRWDVMALLFIVVVVLVAAGGYAAYGAISPVQESTEPGLTVQVGDQINVNYIGMFENGMVFDTSIQSVAENDTLYPKSLSFSAKSPYNPLNFTVGEGQMIAGFDQGVVGMGINQTKVITILPEDAYGYSNDELILTKNLIEAYPVFEWTSNSTTFQDIYHVPAISGTTVENKEYGWNMTVYSVDSISGDILMKNEPMVGEVIQIYDAWDSIVISVDSSANQGIGEIIVKHLLYSEDGGNIAGFDSNGPFLITDVDPTAGTVTIDYNREVVGKTLVFKITIVSIVPVLP